MNKIRISRSRKIIVQLQMTCSLILLLPSPSFANCKDDLDRIGKLSDVQSVDSILREVFEKDPTRALKIVLEGKFDPLDKTIELFLQYARHEIADYLSHPEANELVDTSILNQGPLATLLELAMAIRRVDKPEKISELREKLNREMDDSMSKLGLRYPKEFSLSFSEPPINAFKWTSHPDPVDNISITEDKEKPDSYIMEFQVPAAAIRYYAQNPYEKTSNVLIGFVIHFAPAREFIALLPLIDFSFTPGLSGDITIRKNILRAGWDQIGFGRSLPTGKLEIRLVKHNL